MTAASKSIEKLLSYSVTDWVITSKEITQVISILGSDPNMSQTIIDLNTSDYLYRLVDNILNEGRIPWLQFSQLMGARLNLYEMSLLREPMHKTVGNFLAILPGFTAEQVMMTCYELLYQLRSHGVNLATPSSVPPNSSLIGGSEEAFSGVGASGINATTTSVPFADQMLMLFGHDQTNAEYSNPLAGLGAYLGSLTTTQRLAQATSLVHQPISTVFPYAYRSKIPSRADIIRSAARLYNLEPALVAGFILAEQRDQSQKEDAVEYNSAVSIIQKNTSIGLGQILVSTVTTHHSFQDLSLSGTATTWSHRQIAVLLASDEFNIFGVAHFIRMTANTAATISPTALARTRTVYPNLSIPAYASHSSNWPDDNIKALGSEYTSRPWDGVIFDNWAQFVFIAYQNVKSSGVL